jgi:hypothetical protein
MRAPTKLERSLSKEPEEQYSFSGDLIGPFFLS